MRTVLFFLFITFTTHISSQNLISEKYSNLGSVLILKSDYAPFPHPLRAEGHEYNGKRYSSDEHYNDNSVLVFIPKNFRSNSQTDFVMYFHGWYNNIDSACTQFKLIDQFAESKVNAIFVFPEGPKNAPDSFGGKMEDKDGLKNLLTDITNQLFNSKKISSKKIGKIILAGHSGAYRAIAFSLMHGGLTKSISDVILFDALYAHTEKFAHWIDNSKGRFINIFTEDGGTKNETQNLIQDLDGWNIKYFLTDETKIMDKDLIKNKVIFIHSDLTHNEVIAKRNQFRNYLKTSLIKKLKE